MDRTTRQPTGTTSIPGSEAGPEAGPEAEGARNDVHLLGVLSRDAEVRSLPSGDRLVVLRVVVPRPLGARSDSLPVAVGPPPGRGQRRRPDQALAATVRRASTMRAGDRVRVAGSLQRRFWRRDGAAHTRLEVAAREVQRA